MGSLTVTYKRHSRLAITALVITAQAITAQAITAQAITAREIGAELNFEWADAGDSSGSYL